MASYEELEFEWSMLCQVSTDNWTHTDLQLAAELGKTLLERNRNLEATVKQQQTLIDDRDHEIDYLTKQSTALKSVNESRLRIYEQLEISVQELEKTNQRLTTEAAADKRRLRSLQSTIDSLEVRNDELQKALDEMRGAARGRPKKKPQAWDDALLRRSVSCEHSAQEDGVSGDEDSEAAVEKLTADVAELRAKLAQETSKREDVEFELSALAQEHEVVLQHVAALHEQQSAPLSLQDELDALNDAEVASERNCRKCLCSGGDTSSNPTVHDLNESIEDEGDYSQSSDRGGYVVRLPNGATAWGSQESLASMGQVISHANSQVTSPATDISDVPRNSLLHELDEKYRVLIEKYESLVMTREEQIRQESLKAQQGSNREFNPAEAAEMSGPMSLVLPNGDGSEAEVPRKCQHCSTCSCGITAPHHRPKSNLEEFSEVETSSSGFSEGESRLSNKTTQTEWHQLARIDETTPVVEMGFKEAHFLDLKSPVNPCDKRFQTEPDYGELFKEMFTVLKQSIDENEEVLDSEHAPSYGAMSEVSVSSTRLNESTCTITDDESVSTSVATSKCDENSTESVVHSESAGSIHETTDEDLKALPVSSASLIHEDTDKPLTNGAKPLLRPNSLDLSKNSSSRSSIRQKKQRRQPKSKAELALLRQVEQNIAEASKPVKAISAPPKAKHIRHEKTRAEYMEREAPPKIIGSKVDLMGLCERHRQLQNRRKNKKNRSQNSSKPRSCLQIASLEEFTIPSGDSSLPKPDVVRHKPPTGFARTYHQFQGYQDSHIEFSETDASKKRILPHKINMPSVEVAKLKKLELSYAQVLKAQMERSSNRRAMS